jgi:hypothetical protein
MFQKKFLQKIKIHILYWIIFFRKSYSFRVNLGKYSTASHSTDDNIILYVRYLGLQAHIQNKKQLLLFQSKIVIRMSLNITFVSTLPLLVIHYLTKCNTECCFCSSSRYIYVSQWTTDSHYSSLSIRTARNMLIVKECRQDKFQCFVAVFCCFEQEPRL